MAVPHPTSLKLRHSFGKTQQKLAGDKKEVYISGMSAPDEDFLLLADFNNSRVKGLRVSSGSVSVLFQEDHPEWLVCNSLLVGNQRLLVLEMMGENGTRLLVAVKDNSGGFREEQIIRIDETGVCIIN